MTINYGSAEEVATLAKAYTNSSGVFDATTNPTLDKVETWLDQVSATIDANLAANYFVTPVTEPRVVTILDGFVNGQVAKKVESIHMRGRKGPTTIKSQSDRFDLFQGISDFINQYSRGFTYMGAARLKQFEMDVR